MTTTIHLSQSVRGPLLNWRASDWKRACKWMTGESGRRYTPDALKAEFVDMLSKGVEFIPIGECDNFDPKTGCKGHPSPVPIPTQFATA